MKSVKIVIFGVLMAVASSFQAAPPLGSGPFDLFFVNVNQNTAFTTQWIGGDYNLWRVFPKLSQLQNRKWEIHVSHSDSQLLFFNSNDGNVKEEFNLEGTASIECFANDNVSPVIYYLTGDGRGYKFDGWYFQGAPDASQKVQLQNCLPVYLCERPNSDKTIRYELMLGKCAAGWKQSVIDPKTGNIKTGQ